MTGREGYSNGKDLESGNICKVQEIWGDFRPEDMKKALAEISEHTQHLVKLDTIANHLMGVATGKKQVPLSVFMVVVFTFCMIGLLVFVGDRGIKINSAGLEIVPAAEGATRR